MNKTLKKKRKVVMSQKTTYLTQNCKTTLKL